MRDKILIVDDVEINREILAEILREEYEILMAESGSQALDILEKLHEEIAAILLDLVMPEMDGFEVMREIRANADWTDIPVIFLTADVSPETCEKGGALGAAGFMAKPLEAARMISGVEAVIGK